VLVQEHKARDVSDIVMQKLQMHTYKIAVRILKMFTKLCGDGSICDTEMLKRPEI
jgi:hypothetical protein